MFSLCITILFPVSKTCTAGILFHRTGGGFSNVDGHPEYQAAALSKYLANANALPGPGTFNASGRGYPDVAAIGHNYVIAMNGTLSGEDGTSASAPVWGGL